MLAHNAENIALLFHPFICKYSMYRLPSVQALKESFLTTTGRFPRAPLAAALKTALFVCIIETSHFSEESQSIITKLSLVATTFLPIIIGRYLVKQRRALKRPFYIIASHLIVSFVPFVEAGLLTDLNGDNMLAVKHTESAEAWTV